ncbi:competence protein CoiA family protein [Streptomyces sp. NPDC018972]|uniref:competence protein CoiA family protein n=1 Tax=Streptomyces sp. NPDC018972 TaxID=3365060 RepID=UPI0037A4A03C
MAKPVCTVTSTQATASAGPARPHRQQHHRRPFDRDDFDGFMRGRSRDDFYCGILLGGCGKKLTAKRYLHKKCHFAHRPPVHCRRTRTGEDSADHLYIGQALQHWLRSQGHRSAADLVGHFRQHLQLVARGRGLIKWSTLLKKARIVASTVAPEDGVRLLVAVDFPYDSDRPVLSSLIRADSQQGGRFRPSKRC